MTIRSITRCLVLTAAAAGLLGSASAAEPLMAPEKLQALAREAKTSAEHATVAKQFRLRAESFEAKAIEHEATAKRLAAAAGPMIHKWPAMAPRALQEEKQNAVEARRAANENHVLAAYHFRASVEAMAVAVS